jgi:putative ABC transport system permease protein
VVDFQVMIPEQLLRQAERTKEIFNVVLGAIASISLIVGGIGIMNIMLASVMERMREIGIRRAAGATKRDIVLQFLSEATMISVTGGLIGILLGVGLSIAIHVFAGVLTVVTVFSVLLAFFISIAVGIAFGIFPAKRAADQDPVVCLRYE